MTRIKSVYLLPMAGGLDQYLANKLTREGRFYVVTDPAKAEAVLTDRLGIDFEARMEELYPPPPPPEEPKKDPKDKEKDDKDKKDPSMATLLGEAGGGARTSSFSRGKGNIFLVDRQSRNVLWSHYARPRSTMPDELDQVAGDISKQLHSELQKLVKVAAKSAPAVAAPAAAPVAPAPVPVTPAAPAPAPVPPPAAPVKQ